MIINYKKYNCKSIYLVQFLLVRRHGNWKPNWLSQFSQFSSWTRLYHYWKSNRYGWFWLGWVGLVQSAFWFSFTPLAYILMVAVPNFLLLVQNVDMKIWLGRHFHDSHNMLLIEEHDLASLMGVPIT